MTTKLYNWTEDNFTTILASFSGCSITTIIYLTLKLKGIL